MLEKRENKDARQDTIEREPVFKLLTILNFLILKEMLLMAQGCGENCPAV